MAADNVGSAVHLDGGNLFDDMRIDIEASHRELDRMPRQPRSIRRSMVRNLIAFAAVKAAILLRVNELFVVGGVRRRWLAEFQNYWENCLGGRPFWTTMDFFALLHDYRKRQQQGHTLEWSTPSRHIANWQDPIHLYATLHGVRVRATQPALGLGFWSRIPRKAHIVEYGCSHAPYYASYRNYFSHLNCTWTLADIPNFPFHFTRYAHRNDAEAEFVLIEASRFADPLPNLREADVIILTAVLEHLDNPLFIAEYLLGRLKPGGLFVFDYVKSQASGLDHPAALEQRPACLQLIQKRTRLLMGSIDDPDKTVGFCIAQKIEPGAGRG